MDQRVKRVQPILTATSIRGRVCDLLGEFHLHQTFVNAEAVTIEAVFTFPLPLDAVLLDLEVELDGQVRRAEVFPRETAEEEYEDAIVSGDRACLLQEACPGRYTINVGNLRPGETMRLDYRYVLLGSWDDARWRLHLPTTLAPRYGDAAATGLEPHQIPEVSLDAPQHFTLELTLEGSLATAAVDSPSHALVITRQETGQVLRLAKGRAPLDRDCVLLIQAEHKAPLGHAWMAPDGAGAVVWMSWQPPRPAAPSVSSRDLVLLLDCSGSMAGESLEQSRAALYAIIEQLTETDRLNLIRFGSDALSLFPSPRPATAATLEALRTQLDQLAADLGGTELSRALELAYQQSEGQALDILLITDGEVWGVEPILEAARRTPHRCSTIGVGAAVAVDLVQGLAEATGGLCTLVHPNENMAEQIVRQFERLRPPPQRWSARWPQEPLWVWPPEAIPGFAGRSLHLFAGFATPVTGSVILTETVDEARQSQMTLPLAPWPTSAAADVLPRLSAARRLKALPDNAARELALRHQLISRQTVCLLREQRAADSPNETLPELRKIPHLLAAGWGGMGQTNPLISREPKIFRMRFGIDMSLKGSPGKAILALKHPRRSDKLRALLDDDIDLPALLTAHDSKLVPDQATATPPGASCRRFAFWLGAQQHRLADLDQPLPRIDEISTKGVPSYIIDALNQLLAQGSTESVLIACLLLAFVERSCGKVLQRPAQRRLHLVVKNARVPETQHLIQALIADWFDEDSG